MFRDIIQRDDLSWRKAIGYTRVSTAEQAARGRLGLDVQERAIRAFARERALQLVSTLSDAGVSGANGIESRPALAEALARLEAGEAEVLVVARIDRLARDLVLQETILQRVVKAGHAILSVAEPDLDGDPTRDLIRQVLGAVAQYERAIISARMRAARELKRSRGGFAGGRPPYGWRAVGGELEPVEEEQAGIALARTLRRQGASLRQIATQLEDGGYRPKRGGPWHPIQVRRLLERSS